MSQTASEQEVAALTRRFFKLQGVLDRFDLPLYRMYSFLAENKEVLRDLRVEWTEVYNKYAEWRQMLENMLKILEEGVWGEP